MLRRLRPTSAVIADLPDKTEVTAFCALSRKQAALYAAGGRRARGAARAAATASQRRGAVLASLMRLKQICNHPSQWLGDGDWREADSGKLARAARARRGDRGEAGEAARVHAVPRGDCEPLAAFLAGVFGRRRPRAARRHAGEAARRAGRRVPGRRARAVLRAVAQGGRHGLNLTAASHVVHFDRWWNPAVENQATDRAFRIGQTRNVLVHKFVCRGTVEEQIDALIERKRALSRELLDGGERSELTELTNDELMALVRLDLGKHGERTSDELGLLVVCTAQVRGGRGAPTRRAWRRMRRGGANRCRRSRSTGRTIAATFWGKAWCDNLERYSDFANRLARGRSYVRSGSVIDLQIAAGRWRRGQRFGAVRRDGRHRRDRRRGVARDLRATARADRLAGRPAGWAGCRRP